MVSSSSCFNSAQILWILGYGKASTDQGFHNYQYATYWRKVWCAKNCQGSTGNKTSKPHQRRPAQVQGLQMGKHFNRDGKAGQPEEKFKKSHNYHTATCTTFDCASFSNAETLQLLTTRTFLQMDFYCTLWGRQDAIRWAAVQSVLKWL